MPAAHMMNILAHIPSVLQDVAVQRRDLQVQSMDSSHLMPAHGLPPQPPQVAEPGLVLVYIVAVVANILPYAVLGLHGRQPYHAGAGDDQTESKNPSKHSVHCDLSLLVKTHCLSEHARTHGSYAMPCRAFRGDAVCMDGSLREEVPKVQPGDKPARLKDARFVKPGVFNTRQAFPGGYRGKGGGFLPAGWRPVMPRPSVRI